MSDGKDNLVNALLDGERVSENILRIEASKGIQKSANKLALKIARQFIEAREEWIKAGQPEETTAIPRPMIRALLNILPCTVTV